MNAAKISPFKFRVGKKTGHYQLSKDIFVLSVYIAEEQKDPLQVTFALSTTGRECLEFVCKSLGLHQIIYFGLRFKTHGLTYRWVSLAEAIRPQMEKYGQDFRLYLAVFFHLTDVAQLNDSATRHFYYFQMKRDIMEERLTVSTPELAIDMAGFILQAEFGDYDEGKGGPEAFLNYPLFPKAVTKGAQVLSDLIKQAMLKYQSLKGMEREEAELEYIKQTKFAGKYGSEEFPARDSSGNDLFAGYEPLGLFVRGLSDMWKCSWNEVDQITCNKKTFNIRCKDGVNVRYYMSSADSAKYTSNICSLQMWFYRDVEGGNAVSALKDEPRHISYSSTAFRRSSNESGHSSAGNENENSHWIQGESAVCPSSSTPPPPYRPTPDYECALMKPSLREYQDSPADWESIDEDVLERTADNVTAVQWKPDATSSSFASNSDLSHSLDSFCSDKTCLSSTQQTSLSSALQCHEAVLLPSSEAIHRQGSANAIEKIQCLQRKIDCGLLFEEFQRMPKKRKSAGVSTAKRAENMTKNRFCNVLPYEDTRYLLKPTRSNPTGYINASVVELKSDSGDVKNVCYIAAQAPLRHTVEDFWQLVWESGCCIIVMLSKLVEEDMEMCYRYWPDPGKADKVRFGNFKVSQRFCGKSSAHYITTCLNLENVSTKESRCVYHLQYLDWTENGVPDSVDSMLGFMDSLKSVKQHITNEIPGPGWRQKRRANPESRGSWRVRRALNDSILSLGSMSSLGGKEGVRGRKGSLPLPKETETVFQDAGIHDSSPILVHCTDGAGRTGLFILLHAMIYLCEHNQDMEIPQCLTALRQKRMNLVEDIAQYQFAYACFVQYLKALRLI